MSCPSCGDFRFTNSRHNQVCENCGVGYGTTFEVPTKGYIEMMKAREEYLKMFKL